MDSVPEPPPVIEVKPKNAFQKAWAGFLTFVAATWKFAYPVLKLAKGAKILLTMGSMLLSVWFYSRLFGWPFAAGFVVCILVHEMGHVFAAWCWGIPVSAPVFLPGFGALILRKRLGESAWADATIGYAGPLFGTAAGLACWGIFALTGNALFLGLAFTTFFMNLFNMMPIYPMDGGKIVAAVSPYIWIAGLVGMLGLTLTGWMRNPLLWVFIILSVPTAWSGLRRGTMDTTKRTNPRPAGHRRPRLRRPLRLPALGHDDHRPHPRVRPGPRRAPPIGAVAARFRSLRSLSPQRSRGELCFRGYPQARTVRRALGRLVPHALR